MLELEASFWPGGQPSLNLRVGLWRTDFSEKNAFSQGCLDEGVQSNPSFNLPEEVFSSTVFGDFVLFLGILKLWTVKAPSEIVRELSGSPGDLFYVDFFVFIYVYL